MEVKVVRRLRVRVVRRWREGFEIDERAAKKFGTAGIGLRKEWSVEGS